MPGNIDNLPVEQLAKNRAVPEEQKLNIAARHFETLILKQILNETQKPVIKSSFISSSVRDEIYRDFMTTTLAEALSKSAPFKIAEMVQKQLSAETTKKVHNPLIANEQ